MNYWALAVLAGADKNTIAASDLVDVEDALLPLDPIYFDVWAHVKQLADLSDVSNFESRLMNCPSNLRLTWCSKKPTVSSARLQAPQPPRIIKEQPHTARAALPHAP